jgi:hypothetical protein
MSAQMRPDRYGSYGFRKALDAGLEDVAGMVIPQIASCADMA